MYRRSSSYSISAGLTLIETVVSLALLSTLLVGVLVAFHRNSEQVQRGRRKLAALQGVDAMLYEWMAGNGVILRRANGRLPGNEDLIWRTRVLAAGPSQDLPVDVVRLEVFVAAAAQADRPVVYVDLAVPSERWPPKGG